jgi:polygalacturonase
VRLFHRRTAASAIRALVHALLAAAAEPCSISTGVAKPSSWATVSSDESLVRRKLASGDSFGDFSMAGFMGGGTALPRVAVAATVMPGSDDDAAAIQSAIDTVPAMPLGASGQRGAVLLGPGTFSLSRPLKSSSCSAAADPPVLGRPCSVLLARSHF